MTSNMFFFLNGSRSLVVRELGLWLDIIVLTIFGSCAMIFEGQYFIIDQGIYLVLLPHWALSFLHVEAGPANSSTKYDI